jgi:hypothetical protein
LKKLILFMMLVATGALLMQACAVSTASISDLRICENLSGDECSEDNQTVNADATVIYISGKLNDAPKDTQLKITWRYLTDEQDIDTVTLTADESGSGPFSSSLTQPTNGWPSGKYEVVLDLGTDNSEPTHKEFSIN